MIALPDFEREVQDYIDDVLSGEIVVGKLVRLAVQRHVDDLENGPSRGLRFDRNIAMRAITFFPMCCRHSIGKWDKEPFHLSPWQKFIVWVLMGWRKVSTGMRRFRKAYLSVARKNGKTTWLAALALLLMFADEPFEPGAEIYCAATKEDQAKILHKEAVRMVKASTALDKRARVRKAPQIILWEERNSFFKPLGSDSEGMDGLNPHAVLEDELHAWREHHRDLKEKLATGGAARRQPLEVVITTAGDDRSLLWIEEDDSACRVLEAVGTENIIDDSMFAFIARLDEEDDPFNEEVWVKANPNLHVSVDLEYLRAQANEAKYKPTATNQFLRYHCNIKVGSTERAITPEMWAKGKGKIAIDNLGENEKPRGYAGLDIGRSDDWCAIGAAFPIVPPGETDPIRWEIKAKAWTARHGEFPVHKEPFRSWIANGLLECSEGDQVDFSAVKETIRQWRDQYDLVNWAFDPNFATAFAQDLQETLGIELYKFYQNARMYNEPVRRFQRELHAGRILHGNEPVLTWQAGNLAIRRNAKDEWMPEKGQKLFKVDGMISVLMAFAGAITTPPNEISVYSEPGNLTL